jgi:two-component system cell cycle sensor histidine kinase/response regulator CckA
MESMNVAEPPLPPWFEGLLEANPELRSLLVETSIDPISVWADKTGLVYASPGFERFIGRPAAELLGVRATELIHPDDLGLHSVAANEMRQTGRVLIEGVRLLHGDGSYVVADSASKAFTATDGSVFYVSFTHDITERVQAATQLRASEERYRGLVDGLEAVVWEAEPGSLTYTFVSRRAVDLLGYPLEDWYAPGFWQARLHPEDRERVVETHRQAIDNVENHESLYRMTSASGADVWLRDLVRVVPDGDGKAKLLRGVMVDVTAHLEAAAARTRLESDLRQAQKLDAIGRLAGGIAHDFNNLLTAMQGCAELALKEAVADPVREELEEIRGAAIRAAGLTRQLLAFSRRQDLQPELIDLNDIVLEMRDMLQRLIGTHVELAIDLAPRLQRTTADPSQMQQIVLNLAVNARDAMPAGGRLDLATANVERNGRSFVALSVADTGVGMDAATRERLFEPFFTTKVVGEGTGLGLATVHGIVGQSGGEIEVESEPGVGTTFRILLPAAELDQAARN